MANIFIISDTHFGHANLLKFIVHKLDCPSRGPGLDESRVEHDSGCHQNMTCDCPKMRPFTTVEEMDNTLVDNWNRVVRPQDKVYHLGDVSMKREHIAVVGRCNGHKRLVRGNHDTYPDKYYWPFFESIYGTRVFDDMILSHIPLHPESVKARWTCVHGHVHNNVPANHFGTKYHNVSCEVTNYRPLAVEEVRQRIKEQKFENQRLIDLNLARLGVARHWTDEELHGE